MKANSTVCLNIFHHSKQSSRKGARFIVYGFKITRQVFILASAPKKLFTRILIAEN